MWTKNTENSKIIFPPNQMISDFLVLFQINSSLLSDIHLVVVVLLQRSLKHNLKSHRIMTICHIPSILTVFCGLLSLTQS